MSILEILRGEKPLFKSDGRAFSIAEIEHEFPALLNPSGGRRVMPIPIAPASESRVAQAVNEPFRPHPLIPNAGLHGTYDSIAASKDYELARRGSGDLQSIRQIIIPCLVTGEVKGSPFQLGECTGLLLAPRTVGDNGNEVESSDTARIYVQINNSGVWIPMSFNLVMQGAAKGDAQFIAGPIATLRIQVVNVSQDPQFQPNIFLWLMRNMTVVGNFGAAVGYGPPTNTGAAYGVQTGTGGGSGGGGGTPPPGGGGSTPVVVTGGGGGGGGGTPKGGGHPVY